jgi:hypothetical protein
VSAAIVVVGIIHTAAKNNANNIPEPSAPRVLVRRCRGEAGLTATQLAAVMPALLFWIMLIVQCGLWFHAKQVAAAAAAEAVDVAQVRTNSVASAERSRHMGVALESARRNDGPSSQSSTGRNCGSGPGQSPSAAAFILPLARPLR